MKRHRDKIAGALSSYVNAVRILTTIVRISHSQIAESTVANSGRHGPNQLLWSLATGHFHDPTELGCASGSVPEAHPFALLTEGLPKTVQVS